MRDRVEQKIYARGLARKFRNRAEKYPEMRESNRIARYMGKTSGESNRANRNEKSEMRGKIFARAREKNFAKFFFARTKNFERVRNCKNLEMRKILPKIKKVRKNHFLLEKLSKKCILEIFFTFAISDHRRKFLMRFNRGTEISCGN